MNHIDLNCDMGELLEHISDGTQEALMRSITSVNIACGGHAGDEQTMRTTIEQALRWKLAIGAHLGYPDRANFGRVEMNLSSDAVADSVYEQVRALAEVAVTCGARLTHVKPHGALYNQAVHNRQLAQAMSPTVRCAPASTPTHSFTIPPKRRNKPWPSRSAEKSLPGTAPKCHCTPIRCASTATPPAPQESPPKWQGLFAKQACSSAPSSSTATPGCALFRLCVRARLS